MPPTTIPRTLPLANDFYYMSLMACLDAIDPGTRANKEFAAKADFYSDGKPAQYLGVMLYNTDKNRSSNVFLAGIGAEQCASSRDESTGCTKRLYTTQAWEGYFWFRAEPSILDTIHLIRVDGAKSLY